MTTVATPRQNSPKSKTSTSTKNKVLEQVAGDSARTFKAIRRYRYGNRPRISMVMLLRKLGIRVPN